METIVTILVVGTLNVACFLVGAKVGQKTVRGETIDTPTLNPLDILQEHKEKKRARAEQNKYDIILANIEKYDGSELGQKDVPR